MLIAAVNGSPSRRSLTLKSRQRRSRPTGVTEHKLSDRCTIMVRLPAPGVPPYQCFYPQYEGGICRTHIALRKKHKPRNQTSEVVSSWVSRLLQSAQIASQASTCIISISCDRAPRFSVSFINARLMSRIKQCSVGTVRHGQVNVAHDRLAVAGIRRLRQSPQPCSAVNPSSDRSRGAKRVGRRAPREPLCWHQQCPRTVHTGTNYSQRAHP